MFLKVYVQLLPKNIILHFQFVDEWIKIIFDSKVEKHC